MNVLLLERDDHARTALEMVLSLRGHQVEICHSHGDLVEKLQARQYEIVLYGIGSHSASAPGLLNQVRSMLDSASSMLIGIIDERDITSLTADVMRRLDQVLVRPVDLDTLDLQLESFEQVARSQDADRYDLSMPRVPADALAKLADRGIELGLLLDTNGRIQFTTAGIEFVTGRDPRSYHGRSVLSLIHPDDRPAVNSLISAPDSTARARVRVMGDGERVTWFDVQATQYNDGPDSGSFALVGERAVTGSAAPRPSLASDRYGDDYVAHIDANGQIQLLTAAFAGLLDIDQDARALQLEAFVLEADRDTFTSTLATLPDVPGGQRRCHVRVRTAGDHWRTLEFVCTNLIGIDGINAIVVNVDDVTNRKSLEQHLMRRAFLDPLTSLPNRVYFLNRLERALSNAGGAEKRIAVLFLDLDRFKLINDSLGHEVGDQLLIVVGQRLKSAVRPGDIVARFGGDEMIVLLEDVDDEAEAIAVADRIVDAIRAPLLVGNHEVSVSTSVGIAMSDDEPLDANILIRNADIALYRAKERGASRYVVFDESMAQRVVARMEMENELRQALEQERLTIEFLPELSLRDGRLTALEVLTRWNHPVQGVVDPVEFVDVAEESGLIVRLGRWAFVEACKHLRRWRIDHPQTSNLVIAVNLSVREFQQPDVVDFVTSTLAAYDIPPGCLRIEIAERALAEDADDTLSKVEQLRQQGIQFAIDNFGRGFSSLSIFTRSAFDLLKVDRQFISGDETTVSNLSIVRAITSLAHALGMQVSAEGIETRDHLSRVRAAGCDYGQGYLFSRSLDATTTEALFHSAAANEAA